MANYTCEKCKQTFTIDLNEGDTIECWGTKIIIRRKDKSIYEPSISKRKKHSRNYMEADHGQREVHTGESQPGETRGEQVLSNQ